MAGFTTRADAEEVCRPVDGCEPQYGGLIMCQSKVTTLAVSVFSLLALTNSTRPRFRFNPSPTGQNALCLRKMLTLVIAVPVLLAVTGCWSQYRNGPAHT